MKEYRHYDSKDFFLDDAFRQWVLLPTPEGDLFWEQWLRKNPDKASVVQEAKRAVRLLQVQQRPLSEEEVQGRVRQTARHFRTRHIPLAPAAKPWHQSRWLRVAASVLLFVGLSWGLYTTFPEQASPYQTLLSAADAPLVEKVNNAEKPMSIRLGDGSLVTLQRGSRISYLEDFGGSSREVFLTGEAFFDVAKDPSRPFMVDANELVTKVMGTSFTVIAYESAKEVAVEVKTGKVSVFTGTDPRVQQKASSRELEGVVLTPNQRIVFSREEVRMVKSLVNNPAPVGAPDASPSFVFEEVPISEVFEALEKHYRVAIVYDEELLHDCPLTASLTGQPFFEKLSIICKAIEARYEVIDGQVVIHGKGCDH
ncbi:FecR family protein [soil metagenome]